MDWKAIFENFRRAVADHYFDLSGRVGRPEFWYFVLVNVAISLVLSIILHPVGALYNLAMILPGAGMGARRLQDTGRDGRLVWLLLIMIVIWSVAVLMTALAFAVTGPFGLLFLPGLGLLGIASFAVTLVLLWFWCQPGDPNANAYGPPPPVFDPSVRVSPTP
jgi:uncharacterized membrane protein YhaH (DUF805 family)